MLASSLWSLAGLSSNVQLSAGQQGQQSFAPESGKSSAQCDQPLGATQGKAIGSGVLAASTFAKALAYGVCIEFGFTGGLVLPLLQMGLMLGRVFVNITSVNQVVALSCSLISLAAALMPAPAFLAVLAVSILVLGPSGLVPLFITAGTAHTLCMGIGIPQALAAAAAKRKRRAAS